jgi:hypothetical protein
MKRALVFLIVGVALVLTAQETRRPSGRAAPALATETPTITPTPTVTPTMTPTTDPDPCSGCPEPGGFICELWPDACYACWEDCGDPIATHTPTRTHTPVATSTPTPTPTPQGPACPLVLPGGGAVYLIAYYEHESSVQGTRYADHVGPVFLPPGATARPCRPPCEGHPVGFEWFTTDGVLIKSCGDTSTAHWHLFSDGFESGDLGAWTIGGEDE